MLQRLTFLFVTVVELPLLWILRIVEFKFDRLILAQIGVLLLLLSEIRFDLTSRIAFVSPGDVLWISTTNVSRIITSSGLMLAGSIFGQLIVKTLLTQRFSLILILVKLRPDLLKLFRFLIKLHLRLVL